MDQRILFGGGGSPHRGPLWGRNLPLDPQVIMGRQAISSRGFMVFLQSRYEYVCAEPANSALGQERKSGHLSSKCSCVSVCGNRGGSC
jgi:hypothetical protein